MASLLLESMAEQAPLVSKRWQKRIFSQIQMNFYLAQGSVLTVDQMPPSPPHQDM